MSLDPVETNPDHYQVVFENERVRVLEYRDRPGDITTPHRHPDSVMYTLSSFRRRLVSGDERREVELEAGLVALIASIVLLTVLGLLDDLGVVRLPLIAAAPLMGLLYLVAQVWAHRRYR